MNTLLAVVLVCSLGTAPEDCTRSTALDLIVRPVSLPTECMKDGGVVAAEVFDTTGRYAKTICERRKPS